MCRNSYPGLRWFHVHKVSGRSVGSHFSPQLQTRVRKCIRDICRSDFKVYGSCRSRICVVVGPPDTGFCSVQLNPAASYKHEHMRPKIQLRMMHTSS
jgi:hypothetical protein